MTPGTIKNAQACLSINNDGQVRKIIDIENLLHKHDTALVLDLLQQLFSEYKKSLKQLLVSDKSSSRIDETVSRMFRVFMAISAIKDDIQEDIAA